jgi:putative ABC transport system permease protein
MNWIRPIRLDPLDLLGLGLVGIRIRPLRAVLSALGISISIATIVFVTGVPASSSRALAEQLTRLGTDVIEVTPITSEQFPVQLPPESVAMVSRIGPVTIASAVANTHATVARSDQIPDDERSGYTVLAGKANLLGSINAHLSSGRFLDPATEKLPTVVLGSAAATGLGFTGLTPGRPGPQVYIGHDWFTVIGILQPVPLAPELDGAVMVGWPVAQRILHFDGHPTVIYLKVYEPQMDAVRNVLPATVYPQLPGMVQVSRPSDALAAKRAAQNTFSALIFGLAGVALLVGGVGVANTMVISVLERRREIGLRRALGANRGQIRSQFLTESVVLSGLGGLAGALLGLLGIVGYATYQGWPVVISASSVLAGLGGALAVGVVAGVYPAIRAARLTPTEALAST